MLNNQTCSNSQNDRLGEHCVKYHVQVLCVIQFVMAVVDNFDAA